MNLCERCNTVTVFIAQEYREDQSIVDEYLCELCLSFFQEVRDPMGNLICSIWGALNV